MKAPIALSQRSVVKEGGEGRWIIQEFRQG